MTTPGKKDIHLAAGGQRGGPLVPGDEVLIRESGQRQKLFFMEPDFFFQTLPPRLSWFQRTGGS
ncbi:MAG TPA: hypothetical protein QF623_05725 [SAR324 cluster bacterium]|nr:hypothetical protein [SAR324 cluster bacterium]